MSTLTIDILNPKAEQLLIDLADMNLISIRTENSFEKVLKRIRQKSDEEMSLEEIAAEVNDVRSMRYER